MRIIRFLSGGKSYIGAAVDETLTTARRIEGELLSNSFRVAGDTFKVDKLLAPLVPTDILCIGLNYRDHAAESSSPIPKIPMLFIKASGTLNNPGDPIPVPRLSSMIDYEAELVVVIGKAAKNVSRGRALDHVLGYTCGNDVSARDWQRDKNLGGGQFARGKSFDGFCPLGPAIVTRDEIPNPNALKIRSILNGQIMQDHTTIGAETHLPGSIDGNVTVTELRNTAMSVRCRS